jgi:triacylglycerol esterase/lipase EstA (alpha/beta hydrolase family)
MQQGAVLLHGILRTKDCMQGLADFLEQNNYKVLNIDYPSSKYNLLSLANLIHPQIRDFATQVTKIHFVGYSMGGLIIRAYLKLYNPVNLARVIMLGTPNKGSEIADFLQDFWIYKKLYGPAGQQLITNQTSFKDIFGSVNYELGVVAGRSPYYFIANRIINEESDGRVSINNTKLDGMKEHIIVNSGHNWLSTNQKIWRLTLSFLNHGSFV